MQVQQEEINLKVVKKIKDRFVNKSYIMKDRATGYHYKMKERYFATKIERDNQIQAIIKKMRDNNGCYLGPLTFKAHNVVSGDRTTLHCLNVICDLPEITLESYLESDCKFNGQMLRKLTKDCLKGLHAMQNLGEFHGYLSPKMIARTNDGYAIIDESILIPEERRELNKRRWSPEEARGLCGSIASDIFTLGIVILEAAGCFPNTTINESMKKFSKVVGEGSNLTDVVLNMLKFNEHERPSPSQLLNQIAKKLERKVLTKKENILRSAPFKENTNIQSTAPPREPGIYVKSEINRIISTVAMEREKITIRARGDTAFNDLEQIPQHPLIKPVEKLNSPKQHVVETTQIVPFLDSYIVQNASLLPIEELSSEECSFSRISRFHQTPKNRHNDSGEFSHFPTSIKNALLMQFKEEIGSLDFCDEEVKNNDIECRSLEDDDDDDECNPISQLIQPSIVAKHGQFGIAKIL